MMRPDKLLLSSDLAGIDPTDITDAVREQLAANAEAFLSAGGALSLDDWAELSSESRIAFVVAGKRIARAAPASAPIKPVAFGGKTLENVI